MMPASPTSHLSKSSLFFSWLFWHLCDWTARNLTLWNFISESSSKHKSLHQCIKQILKKIKLLFHSSSQDKHGGEVSLGNRHCQRINWFSFSPTVVLWRIYFYKKDLFCVVPGLQTFASFSEVNTTEYNKDQFYLSSNNEY